MTSFQIGLSLTLGAFFIGIFTTGRIFRRTHGARKRFRRFAARHRVCGATLFFVCLCSHFTFAMVAGWPVPAVHDEHAYVLTADTFASGRLTNPTPRHQEHFDTYHVLMRPTYQAKYPPGQGLFLAFGQVVAGHPAWGAWFATACATVALYWMLLAWVPSRWALWGALLFLFNPKLFFHWSQTYWGGSVAFLGGCLLFGGMRRLCKAPRASDVIWLGLGLGLLANSRPYEGLLAAAWVAVILAVVYVPRLIQHPWRMTRQVLLPLMLTLLPIALAMGVYHHAVTGKAWRMPYQEWMSQQPGIDIATTIVHSGDKNWREIAAKTLKPLNPDDPTVAEAAMEDLIGEWENRTTLKRKQKKVWALWLYYVNWTLSVLLVGVVWKLVQGKRWDWFALLPVLLVWGSTVISSAPGRSQYTAPVGCLCYFLLLQGLRQFNAMSMHRRRDGRGFAQLFVVAAVLFNIGSIIAESGKSPIYDRYPWGIARVRLIEKLDEQVKTKDQPHLVFMRYRLDKGRKHSISNEYVYNLANIDAQHVIWAHDLGPEKNQALIDDHPDRAVWLVTAWYHYYDFVPYEEFLTQQGMSIDRPDE